MHSAVSCTISYSLQTSRIINDSRHVCPKAESAALCIQHKINLLTVGFDVTHNTRADPIISKSVTAIPHIIKQVVVVPALRSLSLV